MKSLVEKQEISSQTERKLKVKIGLLQVNDTIYNDTGVEEEELSFCHKHYRKDHEATI